MKAALSFDCADRFWVDIGDDRLWTHAGPGPLLRVTEWPRERQGEPSSFIEVPGERGWGMPLPQLIIEHYRTEPPAAVDFSASLSLGDEFALVAS